MMAMITQLNKKQTVLDKRVTSIENKVKTQEKKEKQKDASLTKEVNSIKHKNLELQETPASNMSAEFDMAGVIKEIEERDRRSNSVMIYNLPESKSEQGAARKSDDIGCVTRGVHFVWHGSPMLEHKFAENGVFLSNGARESRTAIWGVKVKKNPRKGLYFTIILPGILRACSPSREIIGNDTLVKSNNSQNCPPEGNGVHFIFEVDSILIFSEESDGVDHFLKKGAQHANFGPFLAAHE